MYFKIKNDKKDEKDVKGKKKEIYNGFSGGNGAL